jgi:hypothetical protein
VLEKMAKIQHFRTLEDNILLLKQKAAQRPISLADIVCILSGKGKPCLLILLSLPFCQPIQIPGLSTPVGLAIAFIGWRILFGKKVWIPRKMLSRHVLNHTIEKISDRALRLIRKIKPWIHPRLFWFCHSSLMKKGTGLLIFLLGILLALPLPIPLTNLTAAWSILLLGLGIVEDDGVFILIGSFLSFITISFFFVIAFHIYCAAMQ